MESLNGKTILIGREPKGGRLLVAVDVNGTLKTGAIGKPQSVPNFVSRLIGDTKASHCKITVGKDGRMRISQGKKDALIYVDGNQVENVHLDAQSKVALGEGRFEINISTILAVANKIVVGNSTPPQSSETEEYDISHLKAVWNAYHDGELALKKRQTQIGLLSRVPMFFTLGGGVISGISSQFGWPTWITLITALLGAVGFVLFIFGLYLSITFHLTDKQEALKEEFMDKYICPNDKCMHFLGFQPFRILKQNKGCSYCRCKWTTHNH